MYKTILDILDSGKLSIVERFEIPGSQSKFAAVPGFLFDSPVGAYLKERWSTAQSENSGMWAHQARALDILGHGENVVISTSTASGKSAVFQSIALHKVLQDPDSRIIIFYPLKGLIADQVRSWHEIVSALKLDSETVGRIDGSVRQKDREKILQQAKIIVMTPDVCQAWMMSRLAMPAIKKFVGALSLVIMDEAHTMEGVLGSNFAFLLRRLIVARNHILGANSKTSPLQIVAATATIENPGEHLKQLTGSEFSIVDHSMDGSLQYNRTIVHVSCPENEEFTVAKDLQERVLERSTEGMFITFVDSRKGAETLAIEIDNDDVLPYRAGYLEKDRQKIEQRLQSGDLRGVISTSALELGIDVPHLQVGFNIGIPLTRKAYRQRLGRVGRRGPGVFIIIAPQSEFQRYGTSLREYHDMSVEPSYLYLDNRFMQFAHARCLTDERSALGAPAKLPARTMWPAEFEELYAAARPGGARPSEFDAIAEIGGDTPHYNYPLRRFGETNFELKLRKDADKIGDLSLSQALRECYPGAIYLHMAKPYKAIAWYTALAPYIHLKPSVLGQSTKPRIKTWINTKLSSAIDKHILQKEGSFLAECEMQVSEHVEGYVDGQTGEFHSYRDLQQQNPNMRSRSRYFRTSGVVLCIDESWFKKESMKRSVADQIREVFVHEYSVLPQDLGSASTNIGVQTLDGGKVQNGCIAVFDQTLGSLRLTERLFCNFAHILERLLAATSAQPPQGNEEMHAAFARIHSIFSEFSENTADPADSTVSGAAPVMAEKYVQVFAPKSRVLYRKEGTLAEEVVIIRPDFLEDQLVYQVESPHRPGQKPGRRLLPAARIEPGPTGDSHPAWWNKETEEYEDPPEEKE